MSSSFRTNFFLNASDIREAESSSLSEVHPRLYLNTVHNNSIHYIINSNDKIIYIIMIIGHKTQHNCLNELMKISSPYGLKV